MVSDYESYEESEWPQSVTTQEATVRVNWTKHMLGVIQWS